MHPTYDSKGKVTKTVEQFRAEFDRALAPAPVNGVPSWWSDDDDATAASFMAARQMGLSVPALGA